jgi:signal transduction histidine kinase
MRPPLSQLPQADDRGPPPRRDAVHALLKHNRDELLATCRVKAARRRPMQPLAADALPRFLDDLTSTFEAPDHGALTLVGAAGLPVPAEGAHHAAEGQQLDLALSDLVHGYGDMCEAITDMAFARDVPFTADELHAFNKCLDASITVAVTQFNSRHDEVLVRQLRAETREQVGFLVHELRNAIGTATLAASALEIGGMGMNSPLGAVLRRSLAALNSLVNRSLEQVRIDALVEGRVFALAPFIAEAQAASQLDALAKGCRLVVPDVDPLLMVRANRELLQAALANLLQNAFKFTRHQTDVVLRAHAVGNEVLIQVEDRCGGLAPGKAEKLFTPFHQRSDDRSGLGLGLAIARQSVEADAGTLGVRDLPGTGCVFTIALPRFWPV